ncbi:HAD family hydrolase [Rhodococcus sp. X156]|uniref:HAD family hydrolase n=1 Tax=Rhodococcus sp. X156 TaxID=2499145 RepID=UPI000FD9CDAB|nr:HAD family hydrolase [Rhodococcus sp. X156]
MSAPGPTVICADLDRTLIYSAAALALDCADADAPSLLCVELYQGAPQSFMLTDAARCLAEVATRHVLVPTTTRTVEQYQRVQVPGPPPAYAICANGGRLLVDGAVDGDWSTHVDTLLAASAPLAEVRAWFEPAPQFVRTVRVASELFVYAVVERDDLPAGWLAELSEFCLPRGWTVSMQGRKVYCVPERLRKSAAAAEVHRRVGADRMLAAGDSLLDTDLLAAADLAIRPRHGELHDTGWAAPHLTVTQHHGVRAGAEIVDWFAAQ